MNTAQSEMVVKDKSDEKSGVVYNFPEIASDGSNFGTTFDGVTSRQGIMLLALQAVTAGNVFKIIKRVGTQFENLTLPVSAYAQREMGIRVFTRDTVTGKPYNHTIPAPNLPIFNVEGTDVIPLDNAALAAYIIALEGQTVSEFGNPVVVTKARIVGRNN